jgi:hypothetical protein
MVLECIRKENRWSFYCLVQFTVSLVHSYQCEILRTVVTGPDTRCFETPWIRGECSLGGISPAGSVAVINPSESESELWLNPTVRGLFFLQRLCILDVFWINEHF